MKNDVNTGFKNMFIFSVELEDLYFRLKTYLKFIINVKKNKTLIY